MSERTEAGAATRRWLLAHGYFSWGGDAWIHESDEGTVLSTLDAIDDCLRRSAGDTQERPQPRGEHGEALGVGDALRGHGAVSGIRWPLGLCNSCGRIIDIESGAGHAADCSRLSQEA